MPLDEQTVVKLPPHDLDAEEAVLGSLLIDPTVVYQTEPVLKPDDFYREKNRWTYECMLALHERGVAINTITVAQDLMQRQQLEAAGGAPFLSHLVAQTPTSVHCEHYAHIVGRLSVMRKVISASNQIAAIGYECPPDTDEALSRAEAILLGLRNGHDSDKAVVDVKDALWDFPDILRERAKERQEAQLLMGWPLFDDSVLLRRGTLTVAAGASSAGKTMVAEHIHEQALKAGLNSVYFHNELLDTQLQCRQMCRYMKLVDVTGERRIAPRYKDVEAGVYVDHPAFTETIHSIWEWPGRGFWVYCAGWGAKKIASKIRWLGQQHQIDVVIVDYLQQIPLDEFMGTRSGLNHAQATGAAVQLLKDTAASLPSQPPIVVMSQINSEGETRNSGEPGEKANVHIRIHNEFKASGGDCQYKCKLTGEQRLQCYPHCIQIQILKNTFGPTRKLYVWHDPVRFRLFADDDSVASLLGREQ